MYLQVYKLHKVGNVGKALREAEVAVESAAERAINGDENVEIAAEAALLRVEVVEQILTSELQRAQREAADERACEKWRQQLTALDEELMVPTTFFSSVFCLCLFHSLYFGVSVLLGSRIGEDARSAPPFPLNSLLRRLRSRVHTKKKSKK